VLGSVHLLYLLSVRFGPLYYIRLITPQTLVKKFEIIDYLGSHQYHTGRQWLLQVQVSMLTGKVCINPPNNWSSRVSCIWIFQLHLNDYQDENMLSFEMLADSLILGIHIISNDRRLRSKLMSRSMLSTARDPTITYLRMRLIEHDIFN